MSHTGVCNVFQRPEFKAKRNYKLPIGFSARKVRVSAPPVEIPYAPRKKPLHPRKKKTNDPRYSAHTLSFRTRTLPVHHPYFTRTHPNFFYGFRGMVFVHFFISFGYIFGGSGVDVQASLSRSLIFSKHCWSNSRSPPGPCCRITTACAESKTGAEHRVFETSPCSDMHALEAWKYLPCFAQSHFSIKAPRHVSDSFVVSSCGTLGDGLNHMETNDLDEEERRLLEEIEANTHAQN